MKAGQFTPDQALAMVPKICDALEYAHGEGVLHRDIKPDNILLDGKGRVKIADFGIAKLAGASEPPSMLTRSGMYLGTPAYMAPEQVENPGEVDHRADIYSLGVVLYEMLTGELPLGRFAAPSEKSAVDERIDEIVFRTLEKERERRFQSAEEVKTRVEGLGATPPPAGAAPVPTLPGPRPLVKRTLCGAISTAVSLMSGLILLAGMTFTSVREVDPHDAAASSTPLLGVIALLLTVLAVFGPGIGGVFLGATGLSAVRESGGRLGGAGFGTFAVLAWPLLILWALVGVGILIVTKSFDLSFRPTLGGWVFALAVLAIIAVTGRLTFLIIRKTLRWARGHEEPKA